MKRHIFLIIVMCVELALCLYCLIKKSNHVPAGYICAGLSFALLIVTGYLLLFPRPIVISPTGQYPVAYAQTWYNDTSRTETYADDGSTRELPIAFWYPENYTGDCPLVIFSHGSFGVKENNETLYRELASRGYVVASADHTYHCFSARLSNGKKVGVSGAFMKDMMSLNPQANLQDAYVHMREWMELRTDDLNFILDTIIANANANSTDLDVYKLIDTNKIVAAGHSLGGSAVLGIGRMRNDISAVIALESPFMCDIQGVEDGEFIFDETPYPIPMLNIYSDSSWKHLREWNQYVQNAYYLDQQSDMYRNEHITGIGHMALSDFSLTSPFLTMCMDGKAGILYETGLKQINNICIEFLNSLSY